jgi:hypothetical protein
MVEIEWQEQSNRMPYATPTPGLPDSIQLCDLNLFLGSDSVLSTRGSKQPVTYLVK